MRRLRAWGRRAAVARDAPTDDRDNLVLIDQFCRMPCCFFRTSFVVFNYEVDPPAVNPPALVDLIGGHEHAVNARLSEVGSWNTEIAEVTDLDSAAVWLVCILSVVAVARKRQGQHYQHAREDYLL